MRRIVIALLAACLYGQQKPTLSTVDADLKRNAEDQARAAQAAKDVQSRSDAEHRAALSDLAAKQLRAERAALLRARNVQDSSLLAAYKQEERMAAIEKTIADAAKDRALAEAEAKQSREDLFKYLGRIAEALIVAFILGAARWIYSWIQQKRQEAQLVQIHTLVNSSMVEAMENELDARRSSLASLQELLRITKKAGETPTEEAIGVIATLKDKIGDLESKLKDRKTATDKATVDVRMAR